MGISRIAGKIHVVRGQQVMLDADLAALYGVKTNKLNEAVRRNLARFPGDFMFQLLPDEGRLLRSQIATLESGGRGRYRKYWPYAFTEQGVAMLSSVLNSERAIRVNIEIMRMFIQLRRALTADRDMPTRMKDAETAIAEHDKELTEHATHINEAFAEIRRLSKGP